MTRTNKTRLTARLENSARAPRFSHAECEALFEFYLDSETRGENARARYPAVARHLRSCARCRASYALLTDAARAPAGNFDADDFPPLAFLVPTRRDAGWDTRVRARVGGARLGFGFTLRPDFLRHALVAPALSPLRGDLAATERKLLLSDSVVLGKSDVLAELWLQHSDKSDEARLDVQVTCSQPLPDPLRVTVRWKGHRFSKTLHNGKCSIAGVSVSSLKNASTLRVDFEAGALGATIEEYRESR